MAATKKKSGSTKTVARKSAKTKAKPVKRVVKKAAPKAKRVAAKKKPAAKKVVKKAATPKKAAKKSTATKKVATKKVTKKKSPPKKKVVTKKTAVKKVAPKKTVVAKKAAKAQVPVSRKKVSKKTAKRKSGTDLNLLVRKPVTVPNGKPVARKKLNAKERRAVKANLLAMRDHYIEQVDNLKKASLLRHDEVNTEEDGTDAFDRQFALSIASSEQESLTATVEALVRLEQGTYGICEGCECIIGLSRLKALPFVKFCIECKAKTEQGRARRKIY